MQKSRRRRAYLLVGTLIFVSCGQADSSEPDQGIMDTGTTDTMVDTGPNPLDEGSSDQASSDEGAVDEGTVDEGDVGEGDEGNDVSEPPEDTAAPELAPLPSAITQLDFTQTVEGETVERFALLHAPATIDPDKVYPVFFLFHGNGGTPQFGPPKLGALVDSGAFVAVYPSGHLKSWNMGQEQSKADDVAFVGMIIEKLATYAQLDLDHMFSAGFSNGAGFSHKLAVETDHFQAIASMTSVLIQGGEPTEQTARLSVLQVHGTEDGVCPYDGGPSPTGHVFHSTEESAQIWADHNGCQTGPTQTETGQGNIRIAYSDCEEGTQVVHYGIVGAGHGLPPNTEGGIIALVWGFFQQSLQ
ncbi:MAG: hypothetical protein CMH54_03160 [Myxococcales bacterium]|nr:hypothetical protein [Myxococcales bacterium]